MSCFPDFLEFLWFLDASVKVLIVRSGNRAAVGGRPEVWRGGVEKRSDCGANILLEASLQLL